MSKIHNTSIISSKANIADNVEIGPYCIIGDQVEIASNTVIGSHSVIEGNTKIGSDCEIPGGLTKKIRQSAMMPPQFAQRCMASTIYILRGKKTHGFATTFIRVVLGLVHQHV